MAGSSRGWCRLFCRRTTGQSYAIHRTDTADDTHVGHSDWQQEMMCDFRQESLFTHLADAMSKNCFQLTENRTTIAREILAGVTTVLTMSYILVVQRSVLSQDFQGNPTGMDPGAVMHAICVASAFAIALMGLYGRLPIAWHDAWHEFLFRRDCRAFRSLFSQAIRSSINVISCRATSNFRP